MVTKILEKVKIHLQIKKTERIFSVFFTLEETVEI